MSAVEFQIADQCHEERLRKFAAESSTASKLSLRLLRKGNFLDSFGIEGETTDILVGTSADEVVALATLCKRRCFTSNTANSEEIALLGNVRVAARFQSSFVLARGLLALRQLSNTSGVRRMLAVIQSDNTRALELISRRRARLPRFTPEGRINTLLFDPGMLVSKLRRISPEFTVSRATIQELAPLLRFYAETGKRRRYFPVYEPEDFQHKTDRLLGLDIENIYLAYAGKTLVGTLAFWNQSASRSWIVENYGGALRWQRHVYNALARLSCRVLLPPPGKEFPGAFIALCSIEGDRRNVLLALLRAMAIDYCSAVPRDSRKYFIFALHEKDPLLPAVLPLAIRRLESALFSVGWDGCMERDQECDKIPYVELATI